MRWREMTSDRSVLAASAHDEREQAMAAFAAGRHGLVTTAELAALGLSAGSVAHRVRQGRLVRRFRGVYVVGSAPLSATGRRLAAVLACGDGAAASHAAAGSALGLLGDRPGVVHVTVPPSNGSASRPGIRVHRGRSLAGEEVVVVDGVPVTSIARTLVDLGDVVRPERLRRAFVRAEQLRAVDMTAIDASLGAAGRRRGARLLRELLAVYDPRWSQTRSDLELAMLDVTQRFGLPEPEVNAWLLGRFLVDFLWRDAALIVETDGGEVHGTDTARRDDARRDHALRRAGFRVLRMSHADVKRRPDAVAARVAAALVARSDR